MYERSRWRRCRSPNTTTWSRHSRRIEPIALSQCPFCHGDRGAVGRSPNAHRPKATDEDVTVDGVAVTNDVSRRYFPAIGLGELVRNPFRRWVRGHSQPQDLAAILMQYHHPVEQSE